MQTLREQGFGTEAVIAKCLHRGWKLAGVSMSLVLQLQHQPGSGRPVVSQTLINCFNPLIIIKCCEERKFAGWSLLLWHNFVKS